MQKRAYHAKHNPRKCEKLGKKLIIQADKHIKIMQSQTVKTIMRTKSRIFINN